MTASIMPKTILAKLVWAGIAILGASTIGGIAIHRGESINAIWFVVAAACTYLVAYRFYSAWICAKVLVLDETRATPAERFNNGRDFIPTNKWVVFGHHFAAIAGPGPLIGPTLAMQFGYLPGTIWILVGAVLGGCVQDMVIMFCSTRRDGRSLGQMARDELGPVGGWAAMIGTMMIMVILIAVLGLVIVKAMAHDPWAIATVVGTIPVAMLVGIYMRGIRPGRVLEGTVIGIALLLLCVVGGHWVDQSETLRSLFDWDAKQSAWFVMIYGFAAAALPVWLLLAPRDYLSTFLKLGVVFMLAVAIVILTPEVRMPAMTEFAFTGMGPIIKGDLFPFVFITIACGAISGFHSLVSSGTTPKLLANEREIRMIGYGSMALESFVAIMAVVAATVLDPGVYFAINIDLGKSADETVAVISSWGPMYQVGIDQMKSLATEMGLPSLFARTGGAPSLAVGMAHLFSRVLGGSSTLALWYHFAIMFEALFILTTLDAGTRVGRFMLQGLLKHLWAPLGRVSWYPAVLLTSAMVVSMWGYFLYQGVIDPLGGINSLWPLFGIANQLLALVALCVGTTVIIKMGKARYAFMTIIPLCWLSIVTMTAGFMKVLSSDPKLGFLAHARMVQEKLDAGLLPAGARTIADASRILTNDRVDAFVAAFFLASVIVILVASLHEWWAVLSGRKVAISSEVPYQPRTAFAAGD